MDFIIRVDDRLVHGQVTAGWIRPLGIEQIVLANDEVARDEWERDIYKLAVPPEIEIKILSLNETVNFLQSSESNKKTMVLISCLKDAVRIVCAGIIPVKINIGGLHYEYGKKALAPFIFLSDQDIMYAQQLIARGIKLEGREIPGAPTVNVNELIKGFTTNTPA